MSTGGGSIIVVDPDPAGTMQSMIQGEIPNDDPAVVPNGDHGFGGTALVVSPVQLSGAGADPWIIMGTIETHARAGDPMHGSLHVYKRDSSSSSGLLEVQGLRMDGQSGRPFLYGFCGLAIGDVNGDSEDELVASTFNGDLVVFDLSLSSGNLQIGGVLFWTVLDGSIGVANSIVIADLDTATSGNEIYVAGSRGMRKFHQ
ncbi:MAG: hypothetical protein GY926_23130 [bacterium]|nr:hypothetical protein [bacterium]